MNDLTTVSFKPEEVQLIKDTICKNSTDDELRLFLYTAAKTGLNPLTRQIHAVKRWSKIDDKYIMSIQTGIDGFRLIAERSGKYAGQVGPFWCGEDGIWIDVWLKETPPLASKVGVLRHDFKETLWGTALFKSYCQRNKEGNLTHFWKNMGELMLAKVAEALALRKAFPQELSGLYTTDEMAQASNDEKKVIDEGEKNIKIGIKIEKDDIEERNYLKDLDFKFDWRLKMWIGLVSKEMHEKLINDKYEITIMNFELPKIEEESCSDLPF